jgi:hypothetical protein
MRQNLPQMRHPKWPTIFNAHEMTNPVNTGFLTRFAFQFKIAVIPILQSKSKVVRTAIAQRCRSASISMSDRRQLVLGKSKSHSRLTNGHVFSLAVDARGAWARRYKDLLLVHLNDLGGPDNVSAAEQALLKRACTLIVEAERLEEKFAAMPSYPINLCEVRFPRSPSRPLL